MNYIFNFGKYLFALAIIGFSFIHFCTGSLPSEFMPLPQQMFGKTVLAYITGTIFFISAISIFTIKFAKLGTISIGSLFFLLLLFPHFPKLISNIYNPSEWVAFLETLSFCFGAFIIASKINTKEKSNNNLEFFIDKIAFIGQYIFAVAMLIFGIQHIMYEKFIVSLIPSWIPAKIFLSHIVKLGFIGSAISIIFNWKKSLATTLAGTMFLSWAVILHIPRIISTPKVEPEWTSLFVALAMSGICFIIGSSSQVLNPKKHLAK